MFSDTDRFSRKEVFKCCTQVLLDQFGDGFLHGLKLSKRERENLSNCVLDALLSDESSAAPATETSGTD